MFDNVKIVEIELTHRCNAKCPDCTRTMHSNNGVMETNVDISLEALENFRNSFFFNQLDLVILSGSFGDPLMYRNAEQVIQLLSSGKPNLRVCTNASLRDKDFFVGLADYTNLEIAFAIDGLKDTHSIYRVNTDFDKVINHAQAFIDAGGRARCDTILFEHSRHQAKDIVDMANNMGFQDIMVKNPRGGVSTINVSEEIGRKLNVDIKHKCWYDGQCKTYEKGKIAIDAYGNLQPCSFMSVEYHDVKNKIYSPKYLTFLESINFDINLNNRDCDSIVEDYKINEQHILLLQENNKLDMCNNKCYNKSMYGNY